jgi:hypothetical protein
MRRLYRMTLQRSEMDSTGQIGVWVMVEGRGSYVEGRGSYVEGRGSKVEVEGQKSRSRVKSRGSKFKGRKWEILIFY